MSQRQKKQSLQTTNKKVTQNDVAQVLRSRSQQTKESFDRESIIRTLNKNIQKHNPPKNYGLAEDLQTLSDSITDKNKPQGEEINEVFSLIHEISLKVKKANSTPPKTVNFIPPTKDDISEFWIDRPRSSKESVPEFISRVYKKWLGRGLNRAHIVKIDPSLRNGLKNWLRNNEMPSWLDLPNAYTKHEDLTYTEEELAAYKKVLSIKKKLKNVKN